MLEAFDKSVTTDRSFYGAGPATNDNRQATAPGLGRSHFPGDAVARIFRPARSAMTSGRGRTRGWRLVFERRTAPYIEPLMGYTGGTDTLCQVELSFPTLEAAMAYAERQGLPYVVEGRSLWQRRAGAQPIRLERMAQGAGRLEMRRRPRPREAA